MKRVDALRALSDDHHTALVVARRCRRCRADEAASLWPSVRASFDGHFEPHFRIEEEHLLPALARLGEDDLARRIADDHAALRAAAAPETVALQALRAFGERLERHVRFEEREVFEAVQHRLRPEELRRIARACREVSRTCTVAPA